MGTTDIFDALVQAIEEAAFPGFFAKSEYRRSQHCAEEHYLWLEEHLNSEEKAHLEQARNADLRVTTLEQAAMIRAALAVGVRLALVS